MSPARKGGAAVADRPAPSLEEHDRRRLADAVEHYRRLANRAASGDPFTDADFAAVASTLEALGLPRVAWSSDVSALREYRQLDDKLVEAKQNAEAADARLRLLVGDKGEIAELKRRVRDLEAEAYTLGRVVPYRLVAVEQRRAELVKSSASVLGTVDDAVRLADERRHKGASRD